MRIKQKMNLSIEKTISVSRLEIIELVEKKLKEHHKITDDVTVGFVVPYSGDFSGGEIIEFDGDDEMLIVKWKEDGSKELPDEES